MGSEYVLTWIGTEINRFSLKRNNSKGGNTFLYNLMEDTNFFRRNVSIKSNGNIQKQSYKKNEDSAQFKHCSGDSISVNGS